MGNKKIKWPGRPKKEFKLRNTGRVKIWRWRPRKHEIIHEVKKTSIQTKDNRWFEDYKISKINRKDNLILFLFAFSFLLFLFSIFISFLSEKSKKNLENITDTQVVVNSTWETINSWEIQVDDYIIPQERKTLMMFYNDVNSKNFTWLYSMVDSRLKNSNVFRTYYSKNWITKFLGGLDWENITVGNVQEKQTTTNNPDIKTLTYNLQYKVKWWEEFSELRSMIIIKRWEEYKVGKIMCETQWCSQMPFFNPGKYGIK